MARFAHRFTKQQSASASASSSRAVDGSPPTIHRPYVPMTRREMLLQGAQGFGAVALAALWHERAFGAALAAQSTPTAAMAPATSANLRLDGGLSPRPPPAPARAKSVIFLYMDGGPSQIDTFDPKPRLAREHGQRIQLATIPKTQFADVGTVLASPWTFAQHGQSGLWVSSLLPNLARHADQLCVIRSMTSKFSEHPGANYFLHTGLGQTGRPSMGSWVTYGLGSECQELPGFVVLNGGLIPPGGIETFGNGFLPATYQASLFKPSAGLVADIAPREPDAARQRAKLDLLRELDQGVLGRVGDRREVEAAIANQELAFRMQTAVPGLADLSTEDAATRTLYGLDAADPHTRSYATVCLLARRLVERGVRFIELTVPPAAADRWDQHADLKNAHEANARATDQPIAALLEDLDRRGLLETTLVIWAGEFGRTPMAQGSDGRDHNPFGFTIWLAGGGVKSGTTYGATDDYGYFAIENPLEIHDLHATMLHLLGIDHTKLTWRHGGRDMRLTDVHGEVVRDVLA